MKNLKKGFSSASRRRDGFTLLELLVVVAIVGLLTTVVIVSLNNASNKGKDAGVMSNLRNAISQGEIVFNSRTANKDSYTNVCTNGLVDGVLGVGAQVSNAAKSVGLTGSPNYTTNGTGTGTTATCNNSASAWAAEVPLIGSTNLSPKMWCVDSTGKSKEKATSIGATTAC